MSSLQISKDLVQGGIRALTIPVQSTSKKPDRSFSIVVVDPQLTVPKVILGTVSNGIDMYTKKALIGRGSSGEVHLVERKSDGQHFAMKRSRASIMSNNEVHAYTLVRGHEGFPQMVDFFDRNGYTHVVLTSVGSRIEDIRRTNGGRFMALHFKTVASIAIQMLDRMELLHSLGIIHGDMFPNNLAVGLKTKSEQSKLYVFDFGESVRYRDESTGEHFLNLRKTRLFDIQSLSHTILQLLRPGTPFGDYKHWYDHPNRPSLEQLCRGLPSQVKTVFDYSHTELDEMDVPDYQRLRAVLLELIPEYQGSILW